MDLDTGAVVAVTLQGADRGDTTTLDATLGEAGIAVAEQVGREAELRPDDQPKVNVAGIEETVTDKGYHSGAVVKRMKAYGVRSYIAEKKQKGRRNWSGKEEEQQAVYANRRRVQGEYGKDGVFHANQIQAKCASKYKAQAEQQQAGATAPAGQTVPAAQAQPKGY